MAKRASACGIRRDVSGIRYLCFTVSGASVVQSFPPGSTSKTSNNLFISRHSHLRVVFLWVKYDQRNQRKKGR